MLTISKKQTGVAEDAKITLQVKSKLAMKKDIPSRKLSVETSNGVVCFKRSVRFSENKQALPLK